MADTASKKTNYFKEQPFKTCGLIFKSIGIVFIWATLLIWLIVGLNGTLAINGDLFVGFVAGLIVSSVSREIIKDFNKIRKGEKL
jgi:hypothetical protein